MDAVDGGCIFESLFDFYRSRLMRVLRFRLASELRCAIGEGDVFQGAMLRSASRNRGGDAAAASSGFVALRVTLLETIHDAHERYLPRCTVNNDLVRRVNDSTLGSLVAAMGGMQDSTLGWSIGESNSIERRLSQMPPDELSVLALRVFEGLTTAETSAVTGLDKQRVEECYRDVLGRVARIRLVQSGFLRFLSAGDSLSLPVFCASDQTARLGTAPLWAGGTVLSIGEDSSAI